MLITRTFCAPADTWKTTRERKNENKDVMAPLRTQIAGLAKRKGLCGSCRYTLRSQAAFVGGFGCRVDYGGLVKGRSRHRLCFEHAESQGAARMPRVMSHDLLKTAA